LLTAIGVVFFLTGEDPEWSPASTRGVIKGTGNISAMACAPDGKLVATSDTTGVVQLWYPEIGRRRVLVGPAYAACVALTPDKATLAVGDANSTVSIWDVASGEIRWSVSEPCGNVRVRAVAFSPDGTVLASGGSGRRVCLWDMATRRLKASLAGHTGTVTAITFSPDGRTLISGSQDGTIRCLDGITSQLRWVVPAHPDGYDHGGYVPTVFSVRCSPDGKIVASAANRDPAIRLWDSATGRERMSLCGPASMTISVDFAPDGATLAAGDSRGDVTLWDLESRRPRSSWKAHDGWITSIAISADGRSLVSVGDGTVKRWDIAE
jgi:WD40 repeat protein